jgi:hypothetical protein
VTPGSDLSYITPTIEYNLSDLMVDVLQPLRGLYGNSIKVTSGWRDPFKNAEVGGHPKSYHMRGLAADIRPHRRSELGKVWRLLLDNGIPFDKICLYDTFIHVGINEAKPRRLTYQYLGGKWVNRTHAPYPEST